MLFSSKTTARQGSHADRSLKRLAGAVLIQALEDASNGPRRIRKEALEWIHGRTSSGFTFEFCCSLLGRSPDDVRQRLMYQNFIPKWDAATGTDAYPPRGYRYPDNSWLLRAS